MRISYLFLDICLVAFCLPVFAQADEYISNPSFEDTPRPNRAPKGWFDCGFYDESPVDVHGSEPNIVSDFFGVKEYAEDGQTFLGMVVRDNGTYEGVSTKLLQPLLADSAYKLSILVNQSAAYHSISRTTDQPVNYDQPVLLEIWGGNLQCQMNTLIAEHDVDVKGIWTELIFHFTPEQDIKFLGLYARQAFEQDVNGNVLLDGLQLVKVDAVTFEER